MSKTLLVCRKTEEADPGRRDDARPVFERFWPPVGAAVSGDEIRLVTLSATHDTSWLMRLGGIEPSARVGMATRCPPMAGQVCQRAQMC